MNENQINKELQLKISKLELALAENEENTHSLFKELDQYKVMIHNIDMGITRVDKDLNIIFTNKTVGRWYNKPLSEFIGKKCHEIFAQRDKPCLNCPGLLAIKTGEMCEVETSGINETGVNFTVSDRAYPYFDDDGTVLGFNEVIDDITDRKSAELELKEERERLFDIIEGTNAGTWDWNIETDKLEVNDRWASIMGRDVNDISPVTIQTWRDFVHPEDLPRVTELLENHISGETDYYDAEFRQSHKDGSWVWVNARGKVLKQSDDNKPLRLRGIHLDITKKKDVENEKILLERQVQHAQKLESLGVLAGGIAHDFNNILMGVIGNADLALHELPTENPVRNNLNGIITAAMRATDLAKQMLAYSGKGHFIIEKINVNCMVEEMTHLLKTTISKNALLNLNLSKNIPSIEADITQIRQVFMNLITNASEAIEGKSGIVTVSTGVMEVTNDYLQGVFVNNDVAEGYYTFIEVSDTGCGMNKEIQRKIFDPFFTTKFTGRGLGMAATLGIITGHSGAIKVYSEPSKGTTIKVLFPCCDEIIENKKTDITSKDSVLSGDNMTVLVVDDEETVRAIAKKTLNNYGYNVLTAEDGQEGLNIYKENADIINFVLLDITMPHMGGEETFSEMRKVRSDVQVILSSGYNEQEATNSFAGKGLIGFIQKPYLPSELVKLLATFSATETN
jgi:PAS domain S-box-containing protein